MLTDIAMDTTELLSRAKGPAIYVARRHAPCYRVAMESLTDDLVQHGALVALEVHRDHPDKPVPYIMTAVRTQVGRAAYRALCPVTLPKGRESAAVSRGAVRYGLAGLGQVREVEADEPPPANRLLSWAVAIHLAQTGPVHPDDLVAVRGVLRYRPGALSADQVQATTRSPRARGVLLGRLTPGEALGDRPDTRDVWELAAALVAAWRLR